MKFFRLLVFIESIGLFVCICGHIYCFFNDKCFPLTIYLKIPILLLWATCMTKYIFGPLAEKFIK